MKTKKILVRIWIPLLNKLNIMTKDACLKRDSYLNRVLAHEANMLNKEVPKINSEKAKKYIISEFLALKEIKSVSLQLEVETIEKINKACKDKNIPRDSFINRVLLFLTADYDMLEALFEGYDVGIADAVDNDTERYYFFRPNIFSTIADFTETDPFWLLRGALKVLTYDSKEKLLHDIPIFKINSKKDKVIDFENISLQGFNCFMNDSYVDMFGFFNKLDGLDERKKQRKRDADRAKVTIKNKKERNNE